MRKEWFGCVTLQVFSFKPDPDMKVRACAVFSYCVSMKIVDEKLLYGFFAILQRNKQLILLSLLSKSAYKPFYTVCGFVNVHLFACYFEFRGACSV